ncbi:hypothetical protein D5301_05540 [Stenotrophomonas sp. MH181796]|nr:hypothetical protein [Stenotrophomonas sp. MH181796]
MTFLAGAIAVWALMSKHPPQPRPPNEIDWPAWVQAVGSVAAIATAIWVPAWQRRNDRRARLEEQKIQAKVVAGAIQPFIPAYRRRASFLFEALSEKRPVDALQKVPEDAFDIPETLRQFHPSFHVLGETAELANLFVASLFWLQQGMKVIHHEVLTDAAIKQICDDCEKTIGFATQLSPQLESVAARIDRLPGCQDNYYVQGD